MPEEVNRIVAEHIFDYLFAPTENSKANLAREGIPKDKIFVTGNTIVGSVNLNKEVADKKDNVLRDLGLKPREYFLVTAHRAENFESLNRLKEIPKGLELIKNEFELPLIIPMHPRTRKKINEFGFELGGITAIEPASFLEFLQLEANARLAFNDSGGVQEMTCILGMTCVTLWEDTEGPEALEIMSNALVVPKSDKIFDGAEMRLSAKNTWKNPFGFEN